MNEFINLAIGGHFPIKNPNGINDGAFASVVGQSFDVICWANDLRSKEVQAWKRRTLRYGVFVRDSIPFFLLYFPNLKWSLDVSINILAEKKRNGHIWNTLMVRAMLSISIWWMPLPIPSKPCA